MQSYNGCRDMGVDRDMGIVQTTGVVGIWELSGLQGW